MKSMGASKSDIQKVNDLVDKKIGQDSGISTKQIKEVKANSANASEAALVALSKGASEEQVKQLMTSMGASQAEMQNVNDLVYKKIGQDSGISTKQLKEVKSNSANASEAALVALSLSLIHI